VKRLEYICREDQIQIDPESLFTLAQRSDGGMRDALTLLDQIISFAGTEITIEKTRQALGIISQQMYFELTDIILQTKHADVFPFVQTLLNAGYDLNEFLNGFLEHIRNILVAKTCSESDLLEVYDTDRLRYQTMAASFSELDLLRIMNLVTETIQQIKWSHKQRLIFELALLKLVHLPQSIAIQDVLRKINFLPNTIQKNEIDLKKKHNPPVGNQYQSELPVTTKSIVAETVQYQTDNSADSIRQVSSQWKAFVDKVHSEKIRVGAILLDSCPYLIDGNKLLIHFTNPGFEDIHKDIIHKERDYLTSVMKDVIGLSLVINCQQSKNITAEGQQCLTQFSEVQSQSSFTDTALSIKNKPNQRHETVNKIRDLEQNGLLKNVTSILQAELQDIIE
jgi:DNA polymerase-3 subunit gamma/tau